MGTLRLLLVIALVAANSTPIFGWRGTGEQSVQAFFILSGFFMALVLDSGRYETPLSFYQSRALRLLPVYWAFLLAYIAIAALPSSGDLLSRLAYAARSRLAAATDGSEAAWLTAVSNLFFVLSDWAHQFLHGVTGPVYLAPRGAAEANAAAVASHLVMPQVWALGVGVVFYAAAPFLARLKTLWLLILLPVVYLAGNVIQGVGASYSGPFAYPEKLPLQNAWLFLLGMLCCRALPLMHRLPAFVNAPLALIPFVLVLVWKPGGWQQINIMLAAFALGLPSLFALSRDWSTDRQVGELAYPLYLTHFLFAWPSTLYGPYAVVVCLALSLVLSLLLVFFVQRPVDRYRARLTQPAFARLWSASARS